MVIGVESPDIEGKTKVLHLGQLIVDSKTTIGNFELQQVKEITDLGFLVRSDLSFDAHCKKVAQKATIVMHNIFRGLSTRNPILLVQAYKAYIRPLLESGIVVFNPSKVASVKTLEKVQNNFTRKIMIRTVGFLYEQIPCSNTRKFNLGLESLALRTKKFDLITFSRFCPYSLKRNRMHFFD